MTYPYLLGSVFFTIGCYLAWVEVINANLQVAVERVKRTVRGSVVPEHIVPNTKDLGAKAPPSRKAGDKLTSPRGHDAAGLMSPRGSSGQ